jgi:hypothetical protein
MLSTFLPQIDGTRLDVGSWCLLAIQVLTTPAGGPFIPLLPHVIFAALASSVLPPHAISIVGIPQLLHVWRTDVAIHLQVGRDAYRSRS